MFGDHVVQPPALEIRKIKNQTRKTHPGSASTLGGQRERKRGSEGGR